MKKLIFCLTLALLATASSVQAGEKSENAKTAVAGTAKTECTVEAKTSCADKSACSSKTVAAAKKARSMKGAQLLALR